MQTTEITKLQIRQAINTYKWSNEDLHNKNIHYLETQAKLYSPRIGNIKEEDGAFLYIRHYDGDEYKFIIDSHKMCVHEVFKLNDVAYSIKDVVRQLGDLTTPEQAHALDNMYLESIENYLSKRTNTKVKLHKDVKMNRHGNWEMDLYTENLVSKSGICKAMFKEIHIECNGICYAIDNNTGEQILWIPAFYFYYTHNNNGHNGAEMGKVRWNEKDATFEGYNYETEHWEEIC